METVYSQLVSGGNLDDTMSIITRAMCLMEKSENLSGYEKLDTVISILQKLVDAEGVLPEKVRATLKSFLENQDTIKGIINTIVSATKGSFDINKVASGCVFLGCFKKSMS